MALDEYLPLPAKTLEVDVGYGYASISGLYDLDGEKTSWEDMGAPSDFSPAVSAIPFQIKYGIIDGLDAEIVGRRRPGFGRGGSDQGDDEEGEEVHGESPGCRMPRWFRFLPAWFTDFFYGIIANVRYRVFGKYEACPLPPAEHRARFLM